MKSKKVAETGITLLIFVFVLAIILLFFQRHLTKGWTQERFNPFTSPRQQLEFESGELVRSLKAQQLKELNSYKWQDKDHKFVQIPVDRAIEIYLQNEKVRAEVQK